MTRLDWILLLIALWLVRRLYIRVSERNAPHDFFVVGERTPFTGMNTGSPGHTMPVIVAEDVTLRAAKRAGRLWVLRWQHGAATIYRGTPAKLGVDRYPRTAL
jgi:hypothetical protein